MMYVCKVNMVMWNRTWPTRGSSTAWGGRPSHTARLQVQFEGKSKTMQGLASGIPLRLPRSAMGLDASLCAACNLSKKDVFWRGRRLSPPSNVTMTPGSRMPLSGRGRPVCGFEGAQQRGNGNGSAFVANGMGGGVRESVLGRGDGDVSGYVRDNGAELGRGAAGLGPRTWGEVQYLAGRGEGPGEGNGEGDETVELSPPERDSLKRKRGSKSRRGGPFWFMSIVAAGVFVGVCYFAHWKYGYRDSEWTGPVPPPPATVTSGPEHILGHFKVDEAPLEDLIPVEADGRVKLRTAAAVAFLKMQAAAREDGVFLLPLSGFRSVADQEEIFHGIKAQRRQTAAQRAAVSAPSGYSEHHTGYALDIGDGNAQHAHLEEDFESTTAHDWLVANAALYHFELSFPRGNKQGVMYEPWHWRFVGNDHSLKTFYAQRAQTIVIESQS